VRQAWNVPSQKKVFAFAKTGKRQRVWMKMSLRFLTFVCPFASLFTLFIKKMNFFIKYFPF